MDEKDVLIIFGAGLIIFVGAVYLINKNKNTETTQPATSETSISSTSSTSTSPSYYESQLLNAFLITNPPLEIARQIYSLLYLH